MHTHRWVIVITILALFPLSFSATVNGYIAPPPFYKSHSSLSEQGFGITKWECWDDDSLNPCHPHLNGVDGVSPTDVWTVGDNGTVFRYEGSQWNPVPFPNELTPLSDIDVLAGDSVWAISSAIWQWDGTSWQTFGSLDRTLIALSMVSETDGWAGGYDGELVHWNGTDLLTVTSPINTPIRDIQMISATDGWAVGDSGAILRYNGSVWQSITSPTTSNITSIQMRSATEGYAVGGGVFLRWNGSAWTATTAPGFFASVAMVSPTEGYASAYEGIYRWNGSDWTLDDTGTGNYLNDMIVFPGGSIIAVGIATSILQHDSGGWATMNAPQLQGLNAVAAISPTSVWAVGYEETLMQYNGTTWIPGTYTSLPTSINNRAFYNITFLNATDGWAVGSDMIIRWNGSNWQEVDNGTEEYQSYQGVAAVSSTDVWVVGELSGGSGSVIRRWNGTSWNDVPHPSASVLNTIVMLDTNTGMAAGYRYDSTAGTFTSVVLRWNGSTWSEVATPNITTISAIVLHDANNGWMIGNGGILRLQDGTFTAGTDAYGGGIAFASPDNGWVVGSYGYRWDGNQWNFDQYFPQYAEDALLFEDGTGWAVGGYGVIYRFDPPLTTYLPLIRRGD